MATVQSEAMIIVALHIGSHWSGCAYFHKFRSKHITWPEPFAWRCAIYYEPGDAATPKVKSWGNTANTDYEDDYDFFSGMSKVGTYFGSFVGARKSSIAVLRKGPTVIQAISDYLRLMGASIMSSLQQDYGNDVSMNDVQWCVTLARDWGDHGMKLMRMSMERAGLVQSAISRDGSPYPLRFVHELDAASYHILRAFGNPHIKAGDKLLTYILADLGYNSSHISVQEVYSAERSKYEVKQVVESVGNLGGPQHWDKMFIELLMAKMLPVQDNAIKVYAFKQFFKSHWIGLGGDLWFRPDYMTGTKFRLPIDVQIRWKELDVEFGNPIRDSYDVIELTEVEFERAMKPCLDEYVAVIRRQLLSTPDIKAILLVGNLYIFATFIKKMVMDLNSSVDNVISAASVGAVAMVLDQVLPFTWKGGGKLPEDGAPASSSHGDGITGRTISPEISGVLPGRGFTSPSIESSNGSGGGGVSKPSLEKKPKKDGAPASSSHGDGITGRTISPEISGVLPGRGFTSPSIESSNASGGGGASKLSLEKKPKKDGAPASSSHGDGITGRTISPEISGVLPGRGFTSPSIESSNASGGGGASKPPLEKKPSISRVESVVKKYSWDQVRQMTEGLTSRELGKGGFGTVYLGKLENGKEVAVKVLNQSSQEGKLETFVNEVNLLMQVNHVNLVKLLGYCQDERDVVIYEYMEEGSIGDHLHGDKRRLNDWKERLNIVLQAARGIEYLYFSCSSKIIHRDIKSENILLTRDMVAKVADFGISRLMGGDEANQSHLITRVMGSHGYLDPEYYETGRLRHSSDVYSFGIVLLEMITSRKPVPNPNDASYCIGPWVKRNYGRGGSGAVKAVVDSSLSGNYNPKAMKLVIELAILCINHVGGNRPKMSEVVCVLQKALTMESKEKKSWIPFI